MVHADFAVWQGVLQELSILQILAILMACPFHATLYVVERSAAAGYIHSRIPSPMTTDISQLV